MAYGLSKLHQSTEIVDNNGATQGTILHDGTYTATTTPASTDTLLIKQSGVQKQITYGNLTSGLGGLELIRAHTGALTTTGASGGTGGSLQISGETFSAGDTLAIEMNNSSSETSTNQIVICEINVADTTPTSTLQSLTYRNYIFVDGNDIKDSTFTVKVSASGDTLYFDDSFQLERTQAFLGEYTSTQTGRTLYVGKVWRV